MKFILRIPEFCSASLPLEYGILSNKIKLNTEYGTPTNGILAEMLTNFRQTFYGNPEIRMWSSVLYLGILYSMELHWTKIGIQQNSILRNSVFNAIPVPCNLKPKHNFADFVSDNNIILRKNYKQPDPHPLSFVDT